MRAKKRRAAVKRRRSAVPLRVKETVLARVVAEVGPPPERAQHGEVDSGGAVTPLERLHRDGRINSTERDGCARWYRDYVIGIERVKEPASGGGASGDGEARSLIAAMRWRQACKAMGPRRIAVLTWLIIEERSCQWMADRLAAAEGGSVSADVARDVAVICARDLGAWYSGSRRRDDSC